MPVRVPSVNAPVPEGMGYGVVVGVDTNWQWKTSIAIDQKTATVRYAIDACSRDCPPANWTFF